MSLHCHDDPPGRFEDYFDITEGTKADYERISSAARQKRKRDLKERKKDYKRNQSPNMFVSIDPKNTRNPFVTFLHAVRRPPSG